MAQFDVYENPNPQARAWLPYIVDVQSNLLSNLRTRLVVPLSSQPDEGAQRPRRLSPVFVVAGERLALQPQLTAHLDARVLRKARASLVGHMGEIRDALDAVISGV